MTAVSPPPFPDPPTDLEFHEFLKLCLELGIRAPDDKHVGRPWTPTEFAGASGRSAKQVSNYLNDESSPNYPPTDVERALFGEDQQYLPDWRRELRAALKRTRQRKATPNSEVIRNDERPAVTSVLYENGPAICGGIGIAQGLVHLVNILVIFLTEGPARTLYSEWTYADLVFGFGGVLFGVGVIGVRRWARIGGICFCILALLCAYLWFMDESNSDASRVVFAMNYLTPPFALGALWYLLFAWPKE